MPHLDKPRDEIISMANDIVVKSKGRAKVYFKFTCPACGERCTLEEPNTLYEEGECFKCSAVNPILEAGFMLVLEMHPPSKKEIVDDESRG